MTIYPLYNIDLNIDDIDLQSHLSDRHGNMVEVANTLANILLRLEQIEHNIEKLMDLSNR
jgi:hypothetical protein